MWTRRGSIALSARDRRAIRSGALAVLPALLYFGAVKPYVLAVRAAREEVDIQQTLLEREEELLARVPSVVAIGRATMATARSFDARTYGAADTLAAMTAFNRDVATTLEDAGLVVQRTELRDSVVRHAGLRELTVDIRADGDFERILNSLAALEASTRLIHVSRLTLDRSTTGASSKTPLSLVAVVRGYAE